MSTIQQQIARIEAIEHRLSGGAINAVAIAGADIAADVAGRVINTGQTATGGRFSNYTKPYLLNVRLVRGLGAVKNFSVTNEMWRGFGVKKVDYSGGVYTLFLGGKTKNSADKIGWMSVQEKRPIIAANRVEKDRATKRLVEYFLNG